MHLSPDELDELDLPDACTQEFAAAFKEYCTTLANLTEQVGRGQELSLDQVDKIEAAKLRLENARTLCELYVGSSPDPAVLRQRHASTKRPHV